MCGQEQRGAGRVTFNGLSFGQDGDGTLCHFLLVEDRGDFGSPAVRTHPDEMARLIGCFCRLKEPPFGKQ